MQQIKYKQICMLYRKGINVNNQICPKWFAKSCSAAQSSRSVDIDSNLIKTLLNQWFTM